MSLGAKQSFTLSEVCRLLRISRRTGARHQKRWGVVPGRNGSPRIPRQAVANLADLTDKLLRPWEVAEMLAVSRSTVFRWFWEG